MVAEPNRVIVGTDFSEGSRRALRWAAGLAHSSDTQLVVAHVWRYPWWSSSTEVALIDTPPLAEMEALAIDRTEAFVDDADLGEGSVTPEIVVLHGSPADRLLELARPEDLLVLGSRGHGATASYLLGSVTARCAAHSDCPTTIVPTTGEEFDGAGIGYVNVAVDCSLNSQRALEWALETFPAPTCIRATLVWNHSIGADRDDIDQVGAAVRAEAEDVLDATVRAACETVGCDPSRVAALIVPGDPRHVIADLSDTGDILVMGARGRTGLPYKILGSLTSTLTHGPRVPLVVVPPGPDE